MWAMFWSNQIKHCEPKNNNVQPPHITKYFDSLPKLRLYPLVILFLNKNSVSPLLHFTNKNLLFFSWYTFLVRYTLPPMKMPLFPAFAAEYGHITNGPLESDRGGTCNLQVTSLKGDYLSSTFFVPLFRGRREMRW